MLESLRDALHTMDFENSRALLHRLKGMSSTIGANPIATLCHNKLNAPDTDLRTSASALMEQLFRLHRETADALESYLSSISPGTRCSTASSDEPGDNDVFIRSSDPLQCSSSF